MKLYSNFNSSFGEKIEIDVPKTGEPREIIKQTLEAIKEKYGFPCIVSLRFVGRRVMEDRNIAEICELIQGRRHRIYFGILKENKARVVFGWHKIKKFSQKEADFLQSNWGEFFFEEKGKFLCEKSGGILSPDYLLYRAFPEFFI